MEGDLSDSSARQRVRPLGWKTRLDQEDYGSSHSRTRAADQRSGSATSNHDAMERIKQGESRRTSKPASSAARMQERRSSKQEEEEEESSPDDEITALMDNYFFFNAAHAAAASRGMPSAGRKRSERPRRYIQEAVEAPIYPDIEELESRYARTLEWVAGEGSKAAVLSPGSNSTASSSILMRRSSSTGTAIIRQNQPYSDASDGHRNKDEVNPSLMQVPNPRAFSKDPFLSRSARHAVPVDSAPSRAVSRDVYSASFRVPPAAATRALSQDKRRDGPSATCPLPCQSCGNGPPKKASANDHLMPMNFENEGQKIYSKPNYAMGYYNRNDRLSTSAYHSVPGAGGGNQGARVSGTNSNAGDAHRQRKVHPSDDNNTVPTAGRKVNTSLPMQKQQANERQLNTSLPMQKQQANERQLNTSLPMQKQRQSNDQPLKLENKAEKTSSPAAIVQWFSKLIGKGSKEAKAGAKSSTNRPPTNMTAASDKALNKPNLSTARGSPPETRLAPGTTIQDVILNHQSGNNTATKKSKGESVKANNSTWQPASAAPPPPGLLQHIPPPLPKVPVRPNNAYNSNHNSTNNAGNAGDRGAHVMTSRITDDAAPRFGPGSRSERWAPLHLNQQQRQAKDFQEKQRVMASPGSKPPRFSKSAKESSGATAASVADNQSNPKPPGRLVDAQTCSSKSERSSPVKGQRPPLPPAKQDDQKTIKPPRFIPVDNAHSRVDKSQRGNDLDHDRWPQSDHQNTTGGSKSFMSSYASRSDRYSPARFNREAAEHLMSQRRSATGRSARTSQDNNAKEDYSSDQEYLQRKYRRAGAENYSNNKMGDVDLDAGYASADNINVVDDEYGRSSNDKPTDNKRFDQQMQTSASAPPPDRDIEVLNDFLNIQRELLQNQYQSNRFHFIISNSGFSSMISALCYAWILQETRAKLDGWECVPVMDIPRCSMWNHKQLAWLFQQAGLDTRALLFNDEVDLEAVSQDNNCKISTIGQDIVRAHGEVASYCTIIAEKFFKEIEPSSQAKCIRILLLAGLLVDTENLDFINVFCTRRDEIAASLLLPGAGHKGRSMLLVELKQKHDTEEFYDTMSEKYGRHPGNEKEAAEIYLRHEVNAKMHGRTRNAKKSEKLIVSDYDIINQYNQQLGGSVSSDFFSEDASSFGRSKSSKSYSSSTSTVSIDPGKSRFSPSSPPSIDRVATMSVNQPITWGQYQSFD